MYYYTHKRDTRALPLPNALSDGQRRRGEEQRQQQQQQTLATRQSNSCECQKCKHHSMFHEIFGRIVVTPSNLTYGAENAMCTVHMVLYFVFVLTYPFPRMYLLVYYILRAMHIYAAHGRSAECASFCIAPRR